MVGILLALKYALTIVTSLGRMFRQAAKTETSPPPEKKVISEVAHRILGSRVQRE